MRTAPNRIPKTIPTIAPSERLRFPPEEDVEAPELVLFSEDGGEEGTIGESEDSIIKEEGWKEGLEALGEEVEENVDAKIGDSDGTTEASAVGDKVGVPEVGL